MTAMDVKKTKTGESARATSKSSSKRVRDFIAGLKSEVYKINWTSKEELQLYTKIVVASTFLFGIAIYTADLVIQNVLDGLGTLLKLIGG